MRVRACPIETNLCPRFSRGREPKPPTPCGIPGRRRELNFLFLRNVKTITVEEPLPLGQVVRKIGKTGIDAFWALLMPVIILGTIYSGIGLGNVSPPCAPMLYMAAGVSKLTLDKYVGPTMKLLVLRHLPMVLIVTFVPDLSLTLPRLVLGIE